MRKFHRVRGRRKLFLMVLANNLIMKERMQTTEARAKELRPIVERMVSVAKRQNLAAMRSLLSKLSKRTVYKLYHEIAPRYNERAGGYLRITKLVARKKRDASKLAVIEFV